MSSQDMTRFKLTLHGIGLELEGERDFVEEMYRNIMNDIEVARARQRAGQPSGLESTSQREHAHSGASSTDRTQEFVRSKHAPRDYAADRVIWLHRCSELVHKIYMTNTKDLAKVNPFRALNQAHVRTVYVQDKLLSSIMPQYDRGQTLWAELTRAGRKRIAEAGLASDADKTTVHPSNAIKGTSKT